MTERTRKTSKGPLIIIGGGEDKEGTRTILREVARHLDGGKLVLATVASHEPEGYFESYQKGFDGRQEPLGEESAQARPEAAS